jgi:signal transduction histidine kinase
MTSRLLRSQRDEEARTREIEELKTQKDQAERAIRERRRLEEQLQHALRMEAVGRLASGVAHDFNNLLTVIYGNCEIALEHEAARAPDLRVALKEIHDAAERAAALTQQLLTYSRKQVPQPELLSLNPVVASTEQLLRRLLGEDIRVATILDPDLDEVLFDPGHVEQIIMNLAVNSRDAMPGGGTLTIETANSGQFVVLAISDSGTGMSAETQARAFEPFFTTKDASRGTGLGLSTVDDIVRRAGGHIQIQSALGRGTTFTVYLPRAGQEGAAIPEAGSRGVYNML